MRKLIFTFLLIGVTSLFAKPTVYIVATGGTIAGAASSSTDSKYDPSKLLIDAILSALPKAELDARVNIKTDQLLQISSQNMTPADWLKIAKRVNTILKMPDVSGVVITHGTDTIEETAQFLQLTIKSNKPVVLVGAMRPSTALSADGPKNLWDAIILASDPTSVDRGVMLTFNGNILSGGDVIKSNPIALDTFVPSNIGYLGHLWENKPYFLRQTLQKNTITSEFDVSTATTLPRVDIIYGFAGMRGDTIRASVANGAKGIVVAGVGNGNFSDDAEQALIEASKNGVLVVRNVRMNHGPTTQWGEVDDDKYNFVASWWHTPQQARIIAMLALQKGYGVKDFKKIQQFMLEY